MKLQNMQGSPCKKEIIMEEKKGKKNVEEELNEEALDEVSGGVGQMYEYEKGSGITSPGGSLSKTPQVSGPGVITVPKTPGLDARRKY